MGQTFGAIRFYRYGKKHFTATGWESNAKAYSPAPSNPFTKESVYDSIVSDGGLKGKVFMVTGGNSGIGKEMCEFLAKKGGKVYMVCRNKERGERAQQEIKEAAGSDSSVHLILGDCSLRGDVQRVIEELGKSEQKLDALVCNAGALLNKRSVTSEEKEVTYACHLLNGSFYLGRLAAPLLKQSEDKGRIVFVSSGGMYTTKFPKWNAATSQGNNAEGKYNGQLAYAYAKRGQVLLAKEWSKGNVEGVDLDGVTVVSTHPGWTTTPGVTSAYGSKQKWLEPMRTLWQGTEGICWLCATSKENLVSGEFYLDRSPQEIHLSDNFLFSTVNTEEEIAMLMSNLRKDIE